MHTTGVIETSSIRDKQTKNRPQHSWHTDQTSHDEKLTRQWLQRTIFDLRSWRMRFYLPACSREKPPGRWCATCDVESVIIKCRHGHICYDPVGGHRAENDKTTNLVHASSTLQTHHQLKAYTHIYIHIHNTQTTEPQKRIKTYIHIYVHTYVHTVPWGRNLISRSIQRELWTFFASVQESDYGNCARRR